MKRRGTSKPFIGPRPARTIGLPPARYATLLGLEAGTSRLHQGFVQSHLQKYFRSRLTQIRFRSLAVSSHRGAYRDRHGRGMGCGGRSSVRRAGQTARGRMALDPPSLKLRRTGTIPVEAFGVDGLRTAKSCGPDAPTLASSFAGIFREMTVARKPGHRGEHEGSR